MSVRRYKQTRKLFQGDRSRSQIGQLFNSQRALQFIGLTTDCVEPNDHLPITRVVMFAERGEECLVIMRHPEIAGVKQNPKIPEGVWPLQRFNPRMELHRTIAPLYSNPFARNPSFYQTPSLIFTECLK